MIRKIVFKIKGLECSSCVMDIEGALEDSGLVRDCQVSYARSIVEVEFDPEKVSEEEMVQIIGDTGYTASAVNT
jgi:copper chaperone CopZ